MAHSRGASNLTDWVAPLALTPEAFRRLAEQAVTGAAALLERAYQRPTYGEVSEAERVALRSALAQKETGVPPGDLLDLAKRILARTFGAHPRFLGWIVPSATPLGALADLLAAVANTNMGGGSESPPIYVELALLETLRGLLELAPGTGGTLVSDVSVATLTALAAARSWAAKQLGWDIRRKGVAGCPSLVAYASSEAHLCVQRAVEVLGLGSDNLRRIAVDDFGQMELEAMHKAIAADRQAGRTPFCVVGTLGSMSRGAVDPLPALAELCRQEQLWFHVDASYGGFAPLTARYGHLRPALASAQSITLDAYKALAVPADCGILLVREPSTLADAFEISEGSLHPDSRGIRPSPVPFFQRGLHYTRSFRALKLWVVLQALGRRGTVELAEAFLGMADRFVAQAAQHEDLEVLGPPGISTVCFRFSPPGWRDRPGDLDALNRSVLREIQLGGKVVLNSILIRGRVALRVCFVNYLTRIEDVDAVVKEVREKGRSLLDRETPA